MKEWFHSPKSKQNPYSHNFLKTRCEGQQDGSVSTVPATKPGHFSRMPRTHREERKKIPESSPLPSTDTLLHAGPSTHTQINTYTIKTIPQHFSFCKIWKEYLKIKLFLTSQTSKSLSVCLPGSPSANHVSHSYATLLKLAFLWDFLKCKYIHFTAASWHKWNEK